MGLGKPVLAGWLLVCAPAAWCHAVLLQGTPKAGSEVSGPVIPVTLRFNSRVDGRRSRLRLLGEDGKERSLELMPQTAPDTIAAEIKDAKPGRCRIRWQVLASDGHITRGELTFQIK